MVIRNLWVRVVMSVMVMRAGFVWVPMKMPVVLGVWIGRRPVVRPVRHTAPHTEE